MSAFFQWEQELRRLAFLRNTQSTTGQSGDELIGVYGAKLHARERATTEALKQKAGPCLLYTSPSPRDGLLSRMPSSA